MSKKNEILSRMGDGERLKMSEAEIREDIAAGTEDAARRAKIPQLTDSEQDHLFEIMADSSRHVSVDPGEELIVTDDGGTMSFYTCQDGGGVGVPLSRMQSVLTYERACAADTVSMGHSDYSYKPVKAIINFETNDYYNTSLMTTVPFFYGAQPNLGLYYQPDGPCPNPGDLMPAGKIAEAQAAQEQAAEYLEKDLVFVGKKMASVGCEGLNLDTSGSAGDADFMAALKAVRRLKDELDHMPIILGSANEFILGMHGTASFDGQRLAGMYPHKQVKVAEAAGADIYGLAVGTNTNESVAWNLSRTLTFARETVKMAEIPVHANVGMGVGGVPMMEAPPVDMVSRVSKALAQIGKLDGL